MSARTNAQTAALQALIEAHATECGALAGRRHPRRGGPPPRWFLPPRSSEPRTPIVPYGTPTVLVTTGVYRFTGNPGYLGMALIYSAIAL